jgi:hypothetical protein
MPLGRGMDMRMVRMGDGSINGVLLLTVALLAVALLMMALLTMALLVMALLIMALLTSPGK